MNTNLLSYLLLCMILTYSLSFFRFWFLLLTFCWMDSKTLSQENLEDFAVIWLDSKSHSIDTTVRLRCIINFLKLFDNIDECYRYILSIKNEKIFLITSGSLGQAITPLVHELPQLLFIYIFCENKEKYEIWSKTYVKIHGIFVDQETLYLTLTNDVKLHSNTASISFLNKNEKSLRDVNGTFYWHQLLRKTLLNLSRTPNAKQDLIDIGRKYYVDNDMELTKIDDFDQNYNSKEAIRWYTRDSYLYKLLNKAFRTENIDIIFKFRFFIIDLHNQLRSLCNGYIKFLRLCDLDYLSVYRGQQISVEELQKLKDNIGGLISINSFLSCTTDSDVAIVYAGDSTNHHHIASALFKIIVDLDAIKTDDEQPFANVKEHSFFKFEDEVLFSMSTIFHIESIEMIPNSHIWRIQLTFVKNDNPQMKELDEHFNRRVGNNATEADLSDLLFLMGDYDRAIEYGKIVLDESKDSSSPSVYQTIRCYSIIGEAYSSKECYELALQYYEAGLELLLKYDPSNDTSLSVAYNNIGFMHGQMNSGRSLILEYYEKALQLQLESSQPDYPLIATIFNNMAPLMDNVEESIETYSKALEIREACLPLAHPLIATTYNCLGRRYLLKGDTIEALKCFEYAMNLREKYLPIGHELHIDAYRDIGSLYLQLGDDEMILRSNRQLAKDNYALSLKHYKKALDTVLNCSVAKNHAQFSVFHITISVVYIRLEEYDNAFEHLIRAGENQISPNNGVWHNNMGKIYTKRGDFETGLAHYKQALDLYEGNIVNNHPLFARLYYNLGELYEMQADYANALINYEKALEIGLIWSQATDTCIVQYKNAVQKIKSNSEQLK